MPGPRKAARICAVVEGEPCRAAKQSKAGNAGRSAFQTMTLLDAPRYDAARARRIRSIKIAVFLAIVLGAFSTWWSWNWPEEHRVNTFLATVESGDQSKACGI
jgi:hypothetical protein